MKLKLPSSVPVAIRTLLAQSHLREFLGAIFDCATAAPELEHPCIGIIVDSDGDVRLTPVKQALVWAHRDPHLPLGLYCTHFEARLLAAAFLSQDEVGRPQLGLLISGDKPEEDVLIVWGAGATGRLVHERAEWDRRHRKLVASYPSARALAQRLEGRIDVAYDVLIEDDEEATVLEAMEIWYEGEELQLAWLRLLCPGYECVQAGPPQAEMLGAADAAALTPPLLH